MKPSRTPLSKNQKSFPSLSNLSIAFVPSLFFLICLASLAFKSRAACSNDGDCTNNAKPYCSSGTCVECTANSECGSRSAARCSSGDCVACTSDSECSKFTGYTQCDSGTCYECATGDNSPCTSVSASQCISHQCSSCTSDSGCTQFSSYKYCASYSGTEFCGVCKSDAQCLTYSSAQCIVNYLNSYCTSCSTNSNCAHFDRNLYCSSGNCIQCYTNYECKNFPSASRCDYSVSPPINTCMPCSSSSDCSYVTGLPVCISGTCYECQYDSQCNLTTKAYCNPSHVCVPCISDANCDHFSPLKYCALDTVCKKIKVNITAQSSDRIIPEKLISYKITMATYPVGQTLTFSWNLSDTGITINQQTQYLLALDCFGKNVPLPTSITIGYSISDSSSGYDSLILTLPVNRAPNGGLVSITPTTGVGLSTLFTLKAQSWTDGDGDAISYKFYFAVDKDKKYIPLKDFQTATTLATLLPSGAFDQNSTFYIKVAATDAYGIENYAETSFTVTLSQQSISDVLTNLQNQVISPVLAASFIKNIENEIMSSPLLGCPVCSYHGSCSDGACVCETGYVLSGCELSQTDFNNLISVKTEILTQINTQISNYGVTEFLAEQSLAITRLTTYYLELTNTNFITQSLALINNIMSNAISQNVSLHLAALTDAAQTTENLFTFTTQDCKQKKSITTTLQNNIMPLFQSLPAINLKMRNSTDPYIIDTDQFYICIQQGVLAENLKGESFYCGACLVSLPSAGISAPDGTYVNIELIIPKTTFSDCDPSSFSFSPYQVFFTKLGDKSTSYTASGTVTVTFPISLGLSCTDPYVAAENSTGDLNCVIINDDSLNSLIKDSNLFKITNISALKDFDVLHSPLFYVVAGFSLMMLIVSLWSIYKDRQLDRDLLKLPNKSPSKIYKMLVYISVT